MLDNKVRLGYRMRSNCLPRTEVRPCAQRHFSLSTQKKKNLDRLKNLVVSSTDRKILT